MSTLHRKALGLWACLVGIMTNRNTRSGTLALFLAALVVLAGFHSARAEDQDIGEIRKAAKEGDADAQVELGAKHYLGMGAPQDYREALKWYRLAAEQGNAQAQFAVGRAYAQGEGTRQNYYLAAYWYRKAAEQGYVNGQVALADKYERGLGVAQDMKQAARWYRGPPSRATPGLRSGWPRSMPRAVASWRITYGPTLG